MCIKATLHVLNNHRLLYSVNRIKNTQIKFKMNHILLELMNICCIIRKLKINEDIPIITGIPSKQFNVQTKQPEK